MSGGGALETHHVSQRNRRACGQVHLSVLAGPEAKDYSQVAKKEHLEDRRCPASSASHGQRVPGLAK